MLLKPSIVNRLLLNFFPMWSPPISTEAPGARPALGRSMGRCWNSVRNFLTAATRRKSYIVANPFERKNAPSSVKNCPTWGFYYIRTSENMPNTQKRGFLSSFIAFLLTKENKCPMIEKCHFFRKRLGNTGVICSTKRRYHSFYHPAESFIKNVFCTQGVQAWMWLSPRASSWWPGPAGWICFKYEQA